MRYTLAVFLLSVSASNLGCAGNLPGGQSNGKTLLRSAPRLESRNFYRADPRRLNFSKSEAVEIIRSSNPEIIFSAHTIQHDDGGYTMVDGVVDAIDENQIIFHAHRVLRRGNKPILDSNGRQIGIEFGNFVLQESDDPRSVCRFSDIRSVAIWAGHWVIGNLPGGNSHIYLGRPTDPVSFDPDNVSETAIREVSALMALCPNAD
jgi:hypothetical protein